MDLLLVTLDDLEPLKPNFSVAWGVTHVAKIFWTGSHVT